MRSAIAAIALVGIVTTAPAQTPAPVEAVGVYWTGEGLTKNCRAYMSLVRNQMIGSHQVNFDAGQCYAYIVAVLDTLAFEGQKPSSLLPRFCMPSSVNANAAAEIVAKFADENPQERPNAANAIVRKALAAAYPCR